MTVQGASLASFTPHRPSIDRRRFLLTTLVGALAAPLAARAQHEGKMARVGFLAGARREMLPISVPTFVGQLRELGYIEGQNLVIEFRHADTQERFRELTTELAGVGVQVIYATNPYAVRGAREATMTLPIVGYDYESDPVAAGYAASLARPAGNVTGVFLDQAGVSAKQLQLLTELLPGISRVAVLWDALLATPQHEAVKDAARRLGVAISSIVWRGPDELPSALRAANRDGAQALIVLSTPRIHDRYRVFVAAAALKSRLPSIVLTSNFAQDGALMAYGPIQRDMHRIGATLCRQDPQGRQAGRPSRRAADEVRARHQPQDRQGARPHDPAVAAGAGGSGHRVNQLPYLLPWIRVALLIRSIRATTFDEATWPTAKTVLARALAMRSRLAREGWWN